MLEGDPRTQRFAQGLLDLLDAKDSYTSEHSEQVASLGLLMADEAGLPDDERFALRLGGLLHDVGKIGTPADILRKRASSPPTSGRQCAATRPWARRCFAASGSAT